MAVHRAAVRPVGGAAGWSSGRRTDAYHAEPGPQAWHIRPAVSLEVAASARRDRDAIRRRDDHQVTGLFNRGLVSLNQSEEHRVELPARSLRRRQTFAALKLRYF